MEESRRGSLARPPSGSILAVSLVLIWMLNVRYSECREIRPSDHGLTYQNNPTEVKSPEMVWFFGGPISSYDAASRERRNSSEAWWEKAGRVGSPATLRHDGLKEVLLIASLVCGVVGVSLLIAAAFLYFFRFRRASNTTKE